MKKKAKFVFQKAKFWLDTFVDKELTLFAASLSFYTIFTIIPLLLIMMTLLTSLPSFSTYYDEIQSFIFSNLMPGNSEVVMEQINGFLKNSSKMGTMSFIAVIVSSMLFFKNFEYIANRIFQAKPRPFWQSLTTYWTMITLAPIALGFSFYITGYLASLVQNNTLTQGFNILPIVPYLIIWGIFFILFQISANRKIDPKAALLSSFIIAIIFSISKNAFIYYVFLNKSYATMYGSFATMMFLFLWIYLSWIIFIYGMKLCYIIHRVYEKRENIEKKSGENFTRENSKEREQELDENEKN